MNFSFLKKLLIIFILIFIFSPSCKTVKILPVLLEEDPYKEYLTPDTDSTELFRVLIISDRYDFSQMKFNDRLNRLEDKEGDENIINKLKQYDKIDETCEAALTVWLYPDSGAIMKIRPRTIAPIVEVNTLIMEDIKRWHFSFSGSVAEPNIFDVKYKVILRKIQSDEEIMKEVMERDKKEGKTTDTSDD